MERRLTKGTYHLTKCNPFNATNATRMTPQEIANARDGFIRLPNGTLGFKLEERIILANEIDFINLP